MELKLQIAAIKKQHQAGLNRTFMELKQLWLVDYNTMGAGLNRTFMELKLDTPPVNTSNTIVLIGPSWN